MQLKKLCPNVYTFEVLANSINNKNKLDAFLNDLKVSSAFQQQQQQNSFQFINPFFLQQKIKAI
jgi:hypothetical protein